MIDLFFDIRWALGEEDQELAMAEIGFHADWAIALFLFTNWIFLALWYFAACLGSTIAKWTLVAFAIAIPVLLSVLFLLDALEEWSNPDIALAICVNIIHLVAVMFLFKQDAREWFDSHKSGRETGENL